MVEVPPREDAEPDIRFETRPGIQTPRLGDVGTWPLAAGTVDLFADVAILRCARMVAVRVATDKTRPTTRTRRS